MQLTLWTYEGPPHVGAMRIATALTDVHYVLHAPQGDTYADLLFTMIQRSNKRPPVTYTTFQARDLGGDIGGLAAAVALAAQGVTVQVLEADGAVGGKLQPVRLHGLALDAGPTVMTMRDVFDSLFALAGERLDDHLRLTPLRTLARHTWPGGATLDLHADAAATASAISHFAGARAARQYAAFFARSRAVFNALDASYMRASKPNPLSLTWRCARRGWAGWRGLSRISPFQTLWAEPGRQFDDPACSSCLRGMPLTAAHPPWPHPPP